MMERIWSAYQVEVFKALRQKFTYVAPLLVILGVIGTTSIHPVVRDGVSDYAFIAKATTMSLNILGFTLLLIYCAGLISSEVNNGTARQVLVRPILRRDWVLAKLALGFSYAVVLSVLVAVFSWGIPLVFGELQGIRYGGDIVFTGGQMSSTYLLAWSFSLLPLFAAVAYAVMISSFTRNTAAAVSSAIGIWIVADMIKYPLHIAPLLFSSYLDTPWQLFIEQCDGHEATWFPEIQQGLIVSAISLGIFTALAIYGFSRRNLNS